VRVEEGVIARYKAALLGTWPEADRAAIMAQSVEIAANCASMRELYGRH
jgi:hypothetical protein